MLATPRVDYEPQVTLKGFPFTTHARDGRFSGSIISARGVPDRRLRHPRRLSRGDERGHGDLRAGRSGFRFDSADTLAADDVAASVRLDSPNLGRLLGITDLYVTTPAEPGKAGWADPATASSSVRTGWC